MATVEQFQTLNFIEGGIRFKIALETEPTIGQFVKSSPEAQALAIISLCRFEFRDLAYTVRTIASCSNNLRRTLFDARAILRLPEWPVLRIEGSQKHIEENLWAYVKEAQEAGKAAVETKAEKRIAVLNTLRRESRAFNGYTEVGFVDSQRSAKLEAKKHRTEAKEALSGILTAVMEGRLQIKAGLLTMVKELVKGDNLATCPAQLRGKVQSALNATNNQDCARFAAILAQSFDPFITKAQELELDSLNLSPLARKDLAPSMAPAAKKSLAEIIAEKKARSPK